MHSGRSPDFSGGIFEAFPSLIRDSGAVFKAASAMSGPELQLRGSSRFARDSLFIPYITGHLNGTLSKNVIILRQRHHKIKHFFGKVPAAIYFISYFLLNLPEKNIN